MVASLTLPQPMPPFLVSAGRENMTVSWRSLYAPSVHDKTPFGFNLTVCAEKALDEARLCSYHIVMRGDTQEGSYKLYEDIDTLLPSREGKDAVIFSVTLKNLEPSTFYQYQSTMLLGTFSSSPSEWSNMARTHDITPPAAIQGSLMAIEGAHMAAVNLLFSRPVDDGGKSVTGYTIYARNHNENFRPEWKKHGNYQVATAPSGYPLSDMLSVDNLLPDCTYDFMVSAINVVGESVASNISNTFQLSSASETLKSLGNLSITSSFSDHDSDNNALVVLSDVDQTVSSNSTYGIDVWTAFHSPKKFSVIAPLVLIDLTSDNVADGGCEQKIAVMYRDGDPLSVKARYAQLAGAVGCIIIDSGKCSQFDQRCLPGSDKSRGEYFAETDPPKSWYVSRVSASHSALPTI